MARGPAYKRPFKRRLKGKTNYHKRLKLLKSKKLRLVIRASNNHIKVQVVRSKRGGDETLVSAFSKELIKKYKWNASSGNLPASYLTGYLAGIRTKNREINEAILDAGLFYHKNRVLAAFKGFLDAVENVEIPYREEIFPESLEDRVNGLHIENYAKKLKQDDPELYQARFSGYLKKNKIDPTKLRQMVLNTKKQIESKA